MARHRGLGMYCTRYPPYHTLASFWNPGVLGYRMTILLAIRELKCLSSRSLVGLQSHMTSAAEDSIASSALAAAAISAG